MWESLAVKHIVPAGYGVIIPDCLGYGGSSKPTDPQAYNLVGLDNDLTNILDAVGIQKVISSGHDWGAGLAQRFYAYHPERCTGLITLNVPVTPQPKAPIVLDQLALTTINLIGYFPGWYWYLFSDPVEGPTLLGQHIESSMPLMSATMIIISG
jgi:soluble epoxide hydrolase / lipid-phosphate phosphatase